MLGFLGRALCDSSASCVPDLVVRGNGVARVGPAVLYEVAGLLWISYLLLFRGEEVLVC